MLMPRARRHAIAMLTAAKVHDNSHKPWPLLYCDLLCWYYVVIISMLRHAVSAAIEILEDLLEPYLMLA